jgi:hypothetical protein
MEILKFLSGFEKLIEDGRPITDKKLNHSPKGCKQIKIEKKTEFRFECVILRYYSIYPNERNIFRLSSSVLSKSEMSLADGICSVHFFRVS